MARIQHLSLPNRYKICRDYTAIWQSYFQLFSEDMEDKQITQEMETEFQNTMNILALNHYKFSELCGEFMKDPMEVMRILSQTPSLQTIKVMSESTRSKLMIEWHTTFIEMNKAMGKILSRLSRKDLAALQAEGVMPGHEDGSAPDQ